MLRTIEKSRVLTAPIVLIILMSACVSGSAGAATGTWTKLTHQPPATGLALLLTDGSVMVERSNTTNWYKLTPDATGSYVNGTWTQLASMHDSRQFFASVVLNDGRVLVGGGEYGTGGSSVEIYDPKANTWSYVSSWSGFGIFDSNAKVLPDGRVLLLPYSGSTNYIYDPVNDTWTMTGRTLDRNDEESVVQLPDGTFLCVEIPNAPQSEKYTPATGLWTPAATLPVSLVSQSECGPGLLLYDGRAMFLGASGNTAFYSNATNSWQAGPVIPNGMNCGDKTSAVMPNGHVLIGAGPAGRESDCRTSAVFDFDPATSTYVNAAQPISFSFFLVLPSGEVLANGLSSGSYVYTPAGAPASAWKPAISAIKQNPDGSYSLFGTQLNGLTEGAAFGDDAQMSTNYPIIRLTSGSNVTYAKSYNFSTMGLATGGALVAADFTTALPANGTYSLSVIANGVASDPVPFSVFGSVPPPVITSATTLSVIENVNFNYTITATNGATSFSATGLPAGLSAGGPYIFGTPTVAGTFNIHLTATNAGGTATATLVLTIKPTPVIKSPLVARADVGTTFTYTITAINNPTSFNATGLPPGMTVNTATGVISGTPTTTGSWSVTLSATNASGTGQATLNFTVNPPPTIATASLASGTTGTAYSQKVVGSGGTVPYTWTISSGTLPAGLSLGPTGTISGTPTTAGVSNFTVKLTDWAGAIVTHSYTIMINGLAITSAATANPNPAVAGQNVAFAAAASDSDGDTLSYSWAFGDGATAAGASVTHAYTAAGTYTAIVTVSDGQGSTVSSSVAVTVKAPVVAPAITSALTASGTVGSAFSYTITATNSPTSYSATGLPTGLSVNTSTGVISGTPTAAGASNVTIQATNAGGTGSATLALTINPAKPAITSALTASGTVGSAFSYTITATNSPTSYGATGLPAGLSVNTSTGVISGTPTAAGTSSVTIKATNAGGTGSATLALTISTVPPPPPPAPVITSALTATGTVGSAFSYTITATNSPTSYSATGLPAGLSVNTSTGLISGTPTAAGTSSVTIKATNAGGTGSATLALTINAAPPAKPVITSALTASGTVGTRFGYSIRATNNPTGYNAVGVPPGLSFIVTPEGAALITGTPATAGTFNVTINATNAAGTGSATLVITISAAAAAPAEPLPDPLSPDTAPVTIPMTVSKLHASVPFANKGREICTLTGTIPNLPAQFDPTGQQLVLDVNGVSTTFTLDGKGRGKSELGSILLKLKTQRDKATKKNVFAGGNAPFTVKLQSAASVASWATLWGMDATATTNGPLSLNVTLQLAGNTYTTTIQATLKAKPQVGATVSK